MKDISNNVARNAMLFGHTTQKHCLTEKKKHASKYTDVRKNNSATSKVANTHSKGVMASTEIMNSYLKSQENIQNFKTTTGIGLPTKDSKEASTFNGILNESIFKRREKEGSTKAPTPQKGTFNVLGLFKPGEILNRIEQQDELKKRPTTFISYFA